MERIDKPLMNPLEKILPGILCICLIVAGALAMPVHCEPLDCARAYLCNRHHKDGVTCSACHRDAQDLPGAGNRSKGMTQSVDSGVCVGCHGNFDTLCQATSGLSINPHASPHHGLMLECTQCHKVHRLSDNFCIRCHDTQTTEPGWQSNSQPYADPLPKQQNAK